MKVLSESVKSQSGASMARPPRTGLTISVGPSDGVSPVTYAFATISEISFSLFPCSNHIGYINFNFKIERI